MCEQERGDEEERDGSKSNVDSRHDGGAVVLIRLEKICSNENISCIIFQLLNSNFRRPVFHSDRIRFCSNTSENSVGSAFDCFSTLVLITCHIERSVPDWDSFVFENFSRKGISFDSVHSVNILWRK